MENLIGNVQAILGQNTGIIVVKDEWDSTDDALELSKKEGIENGYVYVAFVLTYDYKDDSWKGIGGIDQRLEGYGISPEAAIEELKRKLYLV